MTTEETLQIKDSLQLIESMINKAKNRFSENGFQYLLWGWVIFCTAVAHFCLLNFTTTKYAPMVWLSCIGAAIVQFAYQWRIHKKRQVKTYADEIIDYIWSLFGISMMVISFTAFRFDNWVQMYTIILMLYGIPTVLSGAVMRFNPLKIGGTICFVLSMISTFCQSKYILLLLALAVLSAWIIPGYILNHKYTKEKKLADE
jgi:hypothetical protein